MKGMVVYYSKTGSTKIVAERLAEKLGFAVEGLEDSKPRPSAGPVLSGILNLTVALRDPLPDIKNVGLIVLVTPIWAWHPTPQISTFVKRSGISGKKVFLVGVGAGATNDKAMRRFARRVSKKGGEVIGTKSLKGLQLKQALEEIEADLIKTADDLADSIKDTAR